MYAFDQSKAQPKENKKRDFKFQKKNNQQRSKAVLQSVEETQTQIVLPQSFQIEWPREIEPVFQPLAEIKTKDFFSIVDKVKAYILAENLKIILENFNETFDTTESSEFDSILQMWSEHELFSFKQYNVLNLLNNQIRVEACWRSLKQKVSNQLGVFDSNAQCEAINPDQIITKIFNVEQASTIILQIESVLQLVLSEVNMIQKYIQLGQHSVQINFTFIGTNLNKNQKIKKVTNNIELQNLLHRYFNYTLNTDQQKSQLFWDELINCLGETETCLISNLLIKKVRLTVYKTLGKEFYLASKNNSWYSRQVGIERPKPQDLAYDASMGLYAISRSRVQYLSSCIPLFRFRHALFEALIATVHEQELRPMSSTDDDVNQLQNPIEHERFLLRKYLEFMCHPTLQQLLMLSLKGDTMGFVRQFNSLSDLSSPQYSQYKISLYDINQRKFVIENENPCKECYLVHYNGFVFGANFAKMIIIRERECKLSQKSDDSEEEPDEAANSDSQQSQSLVKYIQTTTLIKKEDQDSEQSQQISDDQILNVKKGFVLSSQHLTQKQSRQQYRQKMNLKLGKEDHSTYKNLVGTMGIRIKFDENDETIPKRLVCYGSLPLKNNQILKVFEGEKCHIKFLLWALQNVIDYKKDHRIDQTLFNIFTIGGTSKELPLLLRGLVQLSGRDVHFFGDLNKVRCLWHDNIKFYDICNYFEDATLQSLITDWLKPITKETILQMFPLNEQEARLIYEVAIKFIKEIQAIYFNNNTKKYEFHKYQQATASGLALSIYQFMYIDYAFEIKGTFDLDILKKEQQSILQPNLFQNKINEQESGQLRFYKLNRMMSHLHIDQPIPYLFKSFQTVDFILEKVRDFTQVEWKANNFLKTSYLGKEYTFYHTSLYKVSYLSYKSELVNSNGHIWKLHQTNEKNCVLKDKYIWGVELIYGIRQQSIEKLIVTEEIQYFQSRIFSKFVTDICGKIQKCQDRCQMHILEMILDYFSQKFTQKVYNSQSIMHINDLMSMKQPSNTQWQSQNSGTPRKRIVKIYEMQHPFYYCEFEPREIDKLSHVGSLSRLSGFLNSAYRVKLSQSLSCLDLNKNVAYLDSQFLIVKNGYLSNQNSFSKSQQKYNVCELGKWQLLLEADSDKFLEIFSMLKSKFTNMQIIQSQLSQQYSNFKSKFGQQPEEQICNKFMEWKINQQKLENNPKLFQQILQPHENIDAVWLSAQSQKSNVINLSDDEDLCNIILGIDSSDEKLEENTCPFIKKILTNHLTIKYSVQQLSNAIKHFETQFAQGQLEAIVFDECVIEGKLSEQKDIEIKNPDYPIGHPMNARFDQNINDLSPKIIQIRDELERPSSPLGLSSSSSSFTTNLIAQKYNLGPNDVVLNLFAGDDPESKGDLVKEFFEQKPLFTEVNRCQIKNKSDVRKRQRQV